MSVFLRFVLVFRLGRDSGGINSVCSVWGYFLVDCILLSGKNLGKSLFLADINRKSYWGNSHVCAEA